MDHMELEKERGITITSAATQVDWGDATINLIDTPGHVDFTVEVERSLRVLDGAVLVLCAVGGVQAQSLTIDRQMRRYHVPRLAFINKMDRVGADPRQGGRAVAGQAELRRRADADCPSAARRISRASSIWSTQKAYYFDGPNGEDVRAEPIPAEMADEAHAARQHLLEALSMYSDELMEMLLAEEEPPLELIYGVIRSAVAQLEFTPVLLGSAYRNKGVQPLLDAVVRLLPSPLDCRHEGVRQGPRGPAARDAACARSGEAHRGHGLQDGRRPVRHADVHADLSGPVRQGRHVLQPADRPQGAVQPHRADARRPARGHRRGRWPATSWPCWASIAPAATPTPREPNYCTLENMFVPEPVIRMAIAPMARDGADRLSKALHRFRREDPTLHVTTDEETGETIIAGMGELHLEIYVERIRREYNVEVEVGAPKVNYREAPTQAAEFNTRHRKQTGGSGQYAHIVGRLDVLPDGRRRELPLRGARRRRADSQAVHPGRRKGLPLDAGQGARSPAIRWSAWRCIIEDGSYHEVDSSDLAFQICAQTAMREAFPRTRPVLLEPVMKIEIECPSQFQGSVVGNLTSRRGIVLATEVHGADTRIEGEVPLAETFGYSTDLRSMTQGQGTFTHGVRPLQAPAAEPRRRGDRRAEEGRAGRGGVSVTQSPSPAGRGLG